ncbi:MAG: AAA family ATPase [Betaproteobacteria bacterium]|nr:AAA family ATPase [Betaproteobacteria bacterium]
MNDAAQHASAPLIAALSRREAYPHAVGTVRLEETHISWVLLTGDWAYKIKKPVDLGFLDFSTLEARKGFCDDELRLNRRFAPGLYDSVVAITGTPEKPRIGGSGPALEYAVKMRQFPQDALLGRLLERGTLAPPDIDQLADAIAGFHAAAAPVPGDRPYGTPQHVLAPVMENFHQIRVAVGDAMDRAALRALEIWSTDAFQRLRARFAQRRDEACVRECHGDLHLGNIVRIGDRLMPFDCIEFSPALRWIDVMSEAAFLAMDLAHRQRPDLAWRMLNRYLETTGDYRGLDVLGFYWVYRALVRAKIHAIRAAQLAAGRGDTGEILAGYHSYIDLAARFTRPRRPALMITHGLSGSGKTTATQSLLETLGAFRVRSDVERKRLHGLAPLAATQSGVGAGIYSPAANAATYGHLRDLANSILKAGLPVIVDAAFLKRTERDAFRSLAAGLAVPFLILDCSAPESVLRERITAREREGQDASEADIAVLEHQIASAEALEPDERAHTVRVGNDPAAQARNIARKLGLDAAAASG